MKNVIAALLIALAASATPALGGPTVQIPNAPIKRSVQPVVLHEPTNVDLLAAINNLTDQVAQLQGELAIVRTKLESAETRETEDYQRMSYRILQACKVAYLRSFKAGDNPSSGQGGNPFLPDMWCDIGSYPYWKSVQ